MSLGEKSVLTITGYVPSSAATILSFKFSHMLTRIYSDYAYGDR